MKKETKAKFEPELLEAVKKMCDLLYYNEGRSTSDLNAWADKARKIIRSKKL